MDLDALRAQARAVASRMDTRISAALDASRDLTAEETTANEADEAELAGLKTQIATAEAAGGGADGKIDPNAAVITAERERIMGLVDLCPSSIVGSGLRNAIDKGVQPGAFAIELAKDRKARGATVEDLKVGAVQPDQLPEAGKSRGKAPPKAGTRERGQSIVARAAALGHSAVAHLAPKG